MMNGYEPARAEEPELTEKERIDRATYQAMELSRQIRNVRSTMREMRTAHEPHELKEGSAAVVYENLLTRLLDLKQQLREVEV